MAEIVMNNLYKQTQMEITFGKIMLAVYNKEPKIFKLNEVLNIFLNHRKTVIIRRTIFDLEKAKSRAHILEGLRISLENIDEAVKIIRASANDIEANEKLCSIFDLTEIQAKAILDMRLGRLTGLQREKLEAELKELMELINYLELILKDVETVEKALAKAKGSAEAGRRAILEKIKLHLDFVKLQQQLLHIISQTTSSISRKN
jgi:DNA gyrase subunit A